MITTHRLSEGDFAALAAGYGDAGTVARLRGGQYSKRLVQLRILADLLPAESLALLAAAQDRDPAAVADLLLDPRVGAWAGYCLRHRRSLAPADVAYFVALAERAAGGGTTEEPAPRIAVEHAGLALAVTLDDRDPYRDVHGLGASGRLTAAEIAGWQGRLDEAWALLATRHRRYAEAIAAGLTTLVPLRADRASRGVNATSMDAFGSVLLSPPATSTALATALVHEFQHAKLGALLDLVPLYDEDDERRYYAPWRDDPRPIGALLQGAYAFLGVTGFWRGQRALPDSGLYAQFEFARWRERVSRVIDVLETGALTPAGFEFVAGLRGTAADCWVDEPVPTEAAALAADAAEDHVAGWRLRNLSPDPAAVARFAAAWLAGGPRPVVGPVPTETRRSESRALVHNIRLDLTGLRIADPAGFDGLAADPARLAREVPEATAADLAYARGDYSEAVRGYRDLIGAQPDHLPLWAGLSVALGRTGEPGPRAPELALAVHRQLRDRGAVAPDAVTLVRWVEAQSG